VDCVLDLQEQRDIKQQDMQPDPPVVPPDTSFLSDPAKETSPLASAWKCSSPATPLLAPSSISTTCETLSVCADGLLEQQDGRHEWQPESLLLMRACNCVWE
jgi:hypothetical protein